MGNPSISNAYTSDRAFKEINRAKMWSANTPGHTVGLTNGYGSFEPTAVQQARSQEESTFTSALRTGSSASARIGGMEDLGELRGEVVSTGVGGWVQLDFSKSTFAPAVEAKLRERLPDLKAWVKVEG